MRRHVAASDLELNLVWETRGYRIVSSEQKNPLRNGVVVFSMSTIIHPTVHHRGLCVQYQFSSDKTKNRGKRGTKDPIYQKCRENTKHEFFTEHIT